MWRWETETETGSCNWHQIQIQAYLLSHTICYRPSCNLIWGSGIICWTEILVKVKTRNGWRNCFLKDGNSRRHHIQIHASCYRFRHIYKVIQSYMRVRKSMLNWNFSKCKDEKRVEELLPEGWELKEDV